MQAIKQRLTKLERYRRPNNCQYQLDVTILMDDDATDDEIEKLQKARPDRRYIRWGDFCDECV
jgi:hypothetical protein